MMSVTLRCELFAIQFDTFSPSWSRSATIVAENTLTPLNLTSVRNVNFPDVLPWFADIARNVSQRPPRGSRHVAIPGGIVTLPHRALGRGRWPGSRLPAETSKTA